ncbi:Tetraspanin family-domain-containing protein [Piptocephalis cylindrospora]|uniref:Tetraspanin family-domain-containing protein n=1 Tax=Piptocephalis cylindrospora TaxID=1907219 RepID=A0A4V1IYB0_9FUNG|nr:Tetraspanin family-domain-containing protein [Piptocephalis cylindrospora]|eukprot:RKP13929.1 Tetraspanin family-domain-containing protein [Piptocephalis cylindrospora]
MNSPNGKDLLEWSTLLFSVLLGIAGSASSISIVVLLLTSHAALWSHFVLWALLALALGALLTSILGCGAAVSGNLSLRTMYVFALLLLIVPQLLFSTMAVTRTESIERLLETNWQYAYDHHPDYLIHIEEYYKCCGFHHITDRPVATPHSDICPAISPLSLTTLPCLDVLADAWKHDHSPLLGGFGFTLVVLQLMALGTTMALRRRDIAEQEDLENRSLIASEQDRLLANPNHPSERVFGVEHLDGGGGGGTLGEDGVVRRNADDAT